MEKIICIYKIVNPTGRIYIGQSRDYKQRLRHYGKFRTNCQPKLHNSFLKYGINNHQFKIIEHCNINQLDDKEIFYIKKYDAVKKGMNCIVRGQNKEMDSESRNRYRLAKLGEKNPNYGKSTWNKGIKQWAETPHPFLNKKLSDSHKELMKINNPKIYIQGAGNLRAKRITQFTLDNVFIKTWGSSKCIERSLGIDSSSVIKSCKGKLKTCKGYIFKYAD
jgi:group I intron endonuclease